MKIWTLSLGCQEYPPPHTQKENLARTWDFLGCQEYPYTLPPPLKRKFGQELGLAKDTPTPNENLVRNWDFEF